MFGQKRFVYLIYRKQIKGGKGWYFNIPGGERIFTFIYKLLYGIPFRTGNMIALDQTKLPRFVQVQHNPPYRQSKLGSYIAYKS